jgi:hypothetical protein
MKLIHPHGFMVATGYLSDLFEQPRTHRLKTATFYTSGRGISHVLTAVCIYV